MLPLFDYGIFYGAYAYVVYLDRIIRVYLQISAAKSAQSVKIFIFAFFGDEFHAEIPITYYSSDTAVFKMFAVSN